MDERYFQKLFELELLKLEDLSEAIKEEPRFVDMANDLKASIKYWRKYYFSKRFEMRMEKLITLERLKERLISALKNNENKISVQEDLFQSLDTVTLLINSENWQ